MPLDFFQGNILLKNQGNSRANSDGDSQFITEIRAFPGQMQNRVATSSQKNNDHFLRTIMTTLDASMAQ